MASWIKSRCLVISLSAAHTSLDIIWKPKRKGTTQTERDNFNIDLQYVRRIVI
jgi:hypothetical protein